MKNEQKTTIIDQPGKISGFVGNMMLLQIKKWCQEDPDILEGFEEWEQKRKKESEEIINVNQ